MMTPRIIPVALFDLAVFGATGDLAQRKLLRLFHRDMQGQLPPGARIIGSSRRAMTDVEFRALAQTAIEAHVPDADRPADCMARFLERLSYVAAEASQETGCKISETALAGPRAHPCLLSGACSYSGPPRAARIAQSDHRADPRRHREAAGKSGASARALNESIGRVFAAPNIISYHHYLGKETVQNLMALRFANALFEPVWNSGHIDHVQITVAETLGVEGRAGYYNTAGALRDMVQNHMLQLLCLVAMEPPTSTAADALRDEKLRC